jgi:hypothetical protein
MFLAQAHQTRNRQNRAINFIIFNFAQTRIDIASKINNF